MIGPIPDQAELDIAVGEASPRRFASGGWRLLACGLLGAALLACSGDGSSGPDSPDAGGGDPPLATAPIDLPPGETVASLAWAPSEGFVDGYVVFVSRNGGSFDYSQVVPSPSVEIPGVAGDTIRITAVAIGTSGDVSAPSPPSVEIRFHATASAASTPAARSRAQSTPIAAVAENASSAVEPAFEAVPPTPDETPSSDAADPTGEPTGGPPASEDRLSPSARERLLLADARLSISGRRTPPGSVEAGAAWIEARVANELGDDITLAGTAERSEGALRDLVWQDTTGQLFVSDGNEVLQAPEMASTLTPAIRLGETERFVALADVDGDGLREWITEETTTGAAWIRTDDETPRRSARATHQSGTARLLGSGEFDGSGPAELVWQSEDGSLEIERPLGAGPEILLGALPPLGAVLVAIADLNGDGRDDLIARGEDGRVALGQTLLDDQTGGFWIEWSEGHAEADASTPLIATLDLDLDGRAELAWLVGDSVEVRAVGETTPRVFEF